MQGFQPIYTGNTLTQAAGQAGQFTVQAGQARGQMWHSLGQSIGNVAQSVGGAIAKSRINNAPVPESQIKAAEAHGADFSFRKPGKPVTQQEFDRAIANQGQIATLQSGDLNNQRALRELKVAGLRLDMARSEMNLRDFGMSAIPSLFPGHLYPASPLGSVPSSVPQTGTYGLTPAGVYGAVPAYDLPR